MALGNHDRDCQGGAFISACRFKTFSYLQEIYFLNINGR